MDWDWNKVFLAGMGAVAFFGVWWEIEKIKKHLHMEDLTPTRNGKKAISGPRYVPKHKPDQVSEYAKAFFVSRLAR